MRGRELLLPLVSIALAALLLWGGSAALAGTKAANAAAQQEELLAILLPGGGIFSPEEYTGEDESIRALYKGEGGYVVETVTAGYAGDVVVWTGVSAKGTVTGLVVRDLKETFGLGRQALHDTGFLRQFLGTAGEAAVGETVDAITGATVTSKAVTRGVNAAVAVVTGADVSAGATEWGG